MEHDFNYIVSTYVRTFLEKIPYWLPRSNNASFWIKYILDNGSRNAINGMYLFWAFDTDALCHYLA